MARKRFNFQGGAVSDNPLTVGAVTLNSGDLATFPEVVSPDVAAIILDPEGLEGVPEIAYITAHTASATSATILRQQEGTSAREHPQGSKWIHGPTVADFEAQLVDGVTLTVVNGQHKVKSAGISSTELANNSVTTPAIADDAVTQAEIADAAVGTAQLIDANVTAGKLAGTYTTGAFVIQPLLDTTVETVTVAEEQLTTFSVTLPAGWTTMDCIIWVRSTGGAVLDTLSARAKLSFRLKDGVGGTILDQGHMYWDDGSGTGTLEQTVPLIADCVGKNATFTLELTGEVPIGNGGEVTYESCRGKVLKIRRS